MTNKFIYDIKDFNNKYGLDQCINTEPGFVTDEMMQFRLKFLLEELDELANSCGFIRTGDKFNHAGPTASRNLEDAFDALIDLAYVLFGTVEFMGMSNVFEHGWDRVHSCNMKKIRVERAADSKRGSGFDVRKPEGWIGPKFSDLLKTDMSNKD